MLGHHIHTNYLHPKCTMLIITFEHIFQVHFDGEQTTRVRNARNYRIIILLVWSHFAINPELCALATSQPSYIHNIKLIVFRVRSKEREVVQIVHNSGTKTMCTSAICWPKNMPNQNSIRTVMHIPRGQRDEIYRSNRSESRCEPPPPNHPQLHHRRFSRFIIVGMPGGWFNDAVWYRSFSARWKSFGIRNQSPPHPLSAPPPMLRHCCVCFHDNPQDRHRCALRSRAAMVCALIL